MKIPSIIRVFLLSFQVTIGYIVTVQVALSEERNETVTYEVTAYCWCAKCCGVAGQTTASGVNPRVGITVAAPRSIPFGTRVFIEGVGERIVQDRLSRRYDYRFDIFFATHEEAKKFGIKKLKIKTIK